MILDYQVNELVVSSNGIMTNGIRTHLVLIMLRNPNRKELDTCGYGQRDITM